MSVDEKLEQIERFFRRQWAIEPKKIEQIPITLKFAKAVYESSYKYGVLDKTFQFQEAQKRFGNGNFDGLILYSIGSPNTNLMFLTPKGHYVPESFRYFDSPKKLWENTIPDEQIIEWFLSQNNQKYKNEENEIEIPDANYLFPLQQINTIEPHRVALIDTLKWAMKTKNNVIFREHPTINKKGIANNNWDNWQILKSEMGFGENCIYVKSNSPLEKLIDQVDYVIAADSAVMFNSILKRKTVASYMNNQFSEIIPRIQTAEEILRVEQTDTQSLKKYLTWYRDYLCINVNDSNFEKRIDDRVRLFAQGASVEEVCQT